MPISRLLAMRMPMRPPAPTMERSNMTCMPSLLAEIPAMFGNQPVAFASAL